MNKLRIGILAFIFFSSGVFYGADEAGKALPGVASPQPPLVKKAPEKSSWVIIIKSTGKGPIARGSIPNLIPKYLKKQTWVKSGPLMRCDNEWSDGTRTEDWVASQIKFYQDPQTKGLHLLNPRSDPINHDFGTSDFELLDWVGLDDYVGAYSYAGESCYLYEAKEIASGPHGGESGLPDKTLRQIQAPTSATKVYISIETKLPVALINGDGEYLFRFQPGPQAALVMPEPFASLWKAYASHP